MAAVRGILKGNRGTVSRLGSKASGVEARLNTWTRKVTVALEADGSGQVTIGSYPSGEKVTMYKLLPGKGAGKLVELPDDPAYEPAPCGLPLSCCDDCAGDDCPIKH